MKKNNYFILSFLSLFLSFLFFSCLLGDDIDTIRARAKGSNGGTIPEGNPNDSVDNRFWTGNEGTWYQIFTISFYDSDGDGKGDLQGIIRQLDYLSCLPSVCDFNDKINPPVDCNKSLHIDGIWLTPVMPGTSYHKYDTEDYMSIDPDFGNLQDMKNLRDEARARGMKIIVDLTVNQSSSVHPWFLDAMEEVLEGNFSGKASYYNISTSLDKNPDRADVFESNSRWWRPDEMSLIFERLNERRAIEGKLLLTDPEFKTPDDKYIFYHGIYGPWMPDFDYDNPVMLNVLEEIVKFWLDKEKMDLDGFRIDSTLYIFNAPGEWEGDHDKNLPFWTWFVDMASKYKPNVFILGEAWIERETVLRYHTTGKSPSALIFSANFGLIANAARLGSASAFSNELLRYTREIAEIKKNRPLTLFSPFLTTHDFDRIASLLSELPMRKIAASMLLLCPGAPFIYYGEEIGLKGEKIPGDHLDRVLRGPMIFSIADFTGRPNPMAHWYWTQADWDSGQGLPVNDGRGRSPHPVYGGGVKEQLQDGGSLLRHYIKIQNMKMRYPWIAWGKVDDAGITKDPQGIIAAYRVTDDKPGSLTFGRSVVIAHNTSPDGAHGYIIVPSAKSYEDISAAWEPVLDEPERPYVFTGGDSGEYRLKPYTTVIFREY